MAKAWAPLAAGVMIMAMSLGAMAFGGPIAGWVAAQGFSAALSGGIGNFVGSLVGGAIGLFAADQTIGRVLNPHQSRATTLGTTLFTVTAISLGAFVATAGIMAAATAAGYVIPEALATVSGAVVAGTFGMMVADEYFGPGKNGKGHLALA